MEGVLRAACSCLKSFGPSAWLVVLVKASSCVTQEFKKKKEVNKVLDRPGRGAGEPDIDIIWGKQAQHMHATGMLTDLE